MVMILLNASYYPFLIIRKRRGMMIRSNTRITLIAIAAGISFIVIVGVSLYKTGNEKLPDRLAVAEVNGQPITAGEFRLALDRQRSAVIDYFKRKHGAGVDAEFWDTDFSGEIPAELAKQWALQSAIRLRLQLNLASSHGIIRTASYSSLLDEMQLENTRRATAIEAGHPVYGPIRFDEINFIEYYTAKLSLALKEKLSRHELVVTDTQLKEHYEQIKDELFGLENNVQFYFFKVSYILDELHNDSKHAEALLRKIKSRLEQGVAIEVVLKELANSSDEQQVQWTTEQFNDETARYYYKSLPELYAFLTDLPDAGMVSPLIDDRSTGVYTLAFVTDRGEAGYKSFEEVKSNVLTHYMDVEFLNYVEALINNAEVTIIGEHYDQMTVS